MALETITIPSPAKRHTKTVNPVQERDGIRRFFAASFASGTDPVSQFYHRAFACYQASEEPSLFAEGSH